MGVWDFVSQFIFVCVCVYTFKQGNTLTCVFMYLSVRTSVCKGRDRYWNRLYSVTQYFWHDDKALEAIRVNNIQQTGEACLDSPASPLWFDKIVLATTSHCLRLQTVTYCPGNCRGERVRQINLFLIIRLAQFIYSTASQPGRKQGWRRVGTTAGVK